MIRAPMLRLSRQYNKLCDRADFDDPALRAKLRQVIAPGRRAQQELHRKFWEYGMLSLYLEEVGAIREDAEILAVAAGHEEPLYWLANRVGRVVATDIYGQGDFAVDGREADASMLTQPERWAPYDYRRDRLEVRSMNALDLTLADASFDVVYSLSSIEHFGAPTDIRRAAAEMARVLKPGGHLVIATELLFRNHPLDWKPVQTAIKLLSGGRRCPHASLQRRMMDGFRPRELERDVIAPTRLSPVQPMDYAISPASFENLQHWSGAGDLRPAAGTEFPHIVLKAHGSPWTSAFLAMHDRP